MNIEHTIKERLNLQSTQRALAEEFHIFPLDFSGLIKLGPIFNNWSTKQQNKFIITLGGKVNYKRTKEFLGKRYEEIIRIHS